MPTTNRADIPYPGGNDAPYVAAGVQQMADHLDDKLVLRATDSAERDALYPNPSPGMMVVGTADGSVWVADYAGAWHTVLEPQTGWRNLATANNVTAEGAQSRKATDGHVWLTGNLVSTGAGLAPNTVLAWVPSGFEPRTGGARYFAAAASLVGSRNIACARVTVDTDGSIYLDDQETAPPWISLDGLQYWVY